MMFRRSRALALLGVLASVPASFAAQAAPLSAARFQPGHYAVDTVQTRVHFQAKSLFGAYRGDFVEPMGAVAIDPQRGDHAAIDIRFPIGKLTTGDASTDSMLKGSSFFDMDHYPEVRFVASDTAIGNGDTLRIDGKLTMHGQTRPIAIAARLAGISPDPATGRPRLHFTGQANVRRSQFGMGFGRPFVSNRVYLDIDATFTQD
ncbi:YceI family protein [Sphingobium ummariense]|uniref:Lipid/polyisoprenoid-binding YceI-like domain-containing protein n=1 Tax=Sphingobium ummariense RL-3 TaxID=1346791 RepID=T0K4F3_9SPHN|nr:YceI family protein [Sphingobium ummariense]EQB31484.1 hypothetical protein M529_14290 [Sphingobium ummariense RL-3]